MDVETAAGGQAVFIYPGGLLLPDRGSTGWTLSDGSDDLLFVDTLLDKYTSELCIDQNRVFATGHSFGGCMSNAVGCFRGEVFRAIAPVAGCGPNTRAQCTGQIATLQIHSPNDTSTQYSGAISACTRYLRGNQCEERPECGCHWVDALSDPSDECIQEAQEAYDPGVSIEVTERDDQPPVLRQYVGCNDGYPVVFIDHWRRERSPDDTREERWHNPPPWSPAVIWNFFSGLSVPATP
jgi:poly(3-hydroxybutyrate) depolymerase